MKLNHDCVRELMMYFEKNLTLSNEIDVDTIELKGFEKDEIKYTALKLREANFINALVDKDITGNCYVIVQSITWHGHEFLDNIRDNQVWKITKSKLSTFASVSLSIVANVAAQVIANLINQTLNP